MQAFCSSLGFEDWLGLLKKSTYLSICRISILEKGTRDNPYLTGLENYDKKMLGMTNDPVATDTFNLDVRSK